MTGTLHIVVAMKPLDGNFVQNASKHGVAGLNIDGTRIAFASQKDFESAKFGTQTDLRGGGLCTKRPSDGHILAKGVEANMKGRWPANVILGHLEGCRRAGVKKVRVIGGDISGVSALGQKSGWNKHNNITTSVDRHADADGKETVEQWECVEGCPVKVLDKQSGQSGSNWRPNKANGKTSIWGSGKYQKTNTVDDSGGASRFFKQVDEYEVEDGRG